MTASFIISTVSNVSSQTNTSIANSPAQDPQPRRQGPSSRHTLGEAASDIDDPQNARRSTLLFLILIYYLFVFFIYYYLFIIH